MTVDAKTGRTIHETVAPRSASTGHNKPQYDAAAAIHAAMTNAAQEGKRQATLTLWMYQDGANYGQAEIKRVFGKDFDRTEWMDKRLSAISTEFVKALKLVTEYKKNLDRAKTATQKAAVTMDRDEAKKKVNAARAMFTNALKACGALRALNPLTVTLNRWGIIEATDYQRNDDKTVAVDDNGEKVVEDVEFTGRELVKVGNEKLGLVSPNAGNVTPPSEKPGEVARLNKGVLEAARNAINIAIASDAKLAPEVIDEQDALLITLLRARFVTAGKINDKALHDWFLAHNKVSTGNGKPSMPHVASTAKPVPAEPAAQPKPRTARGG